MSFYVSFQELFLTWLTGGTVVLLSEAQRRDPEQLVQVLRRHQVGRLFCPHGAPGARRHAVGSAFRSPRPSGRRSVADVRHPAGLPGHHGRLAVDNQYGRTEATVGPARRLTGDRTWPAAVPIGRPLPGTQCSSSIRCCGPCRSACPVRSASAGPRPRRQGGPTSPRSGWCRIRLARTRGPGCTGPATAPGLAADGTLRFLGRTDDQGKCAVTGSSPGRSSAGRVHPAVADQP